MDWHTRSLHFEAPKQEPLNCKAIVTSMVGEIWVNAQYGGSFLKIFVFHKSPRSSVQFLILCGTIG